MTFQQLIIVGNVGRDPEIKYVNGIPLCVFSVAVNKVTGSGEQRRERTTWFRVTIWRQRAEIAGQLIKKGQRVLIVGEVSASAYVARDGKASASLEVTASEFKLLSGRDGGADDEAIADTAVGSRRPPAADIDDISEDVEDLPF
ncbi:MAG: single-stranded DNA-binding protein [Aggregatilineales bacterium]